VEAVVVEAEVLLLRATDLMGQRELTLTDPTIVGFKDLQSEAFGCPKSWANALKGVSKIAIATQAMVFGHAQVQDHQLVALTGVFERP
jgi:hypothetical protein